MNPSQLPIVAIVGEPNVGKSTLLNKIAGSRSAVTSSVPGTTRDRQYTDSQWNGVAFTLVDTAGFVFNPRDELAQSLNQQIQAALAQAEIILWVVDGKLGPGAVERKVLRALRQSKQPVVLAINKLDSPKTMDELAGPFQKLGVKKSFGVSALTGRGVGGLLDCLAQNLRDLGWPKTYAPAEHGIAVAIVGKPNVGKSSLFNAILKEERVVVSAAPGTTRTAIDSRLEIRGQAYTFIDTAGLKKKTYRQSEPDVYSGFQSFKAMRRSDVCLLVLDATGEITVQDQKIAQEIMQMQKGLIVLVNKIDLYAGQLPSSRSAGGPGERLKEADKQKLRDYVSLHFPFLWMCPVFLVSAATQKNLSQALAAIKPIFEARHKTASQAALDEFLQKKLKTNPPKLLRDQKKPKIFGLRQTAVNPPTFELLVNHPAAISKQFRDYLAKGLIKNLDFWGTPVKLVLRGKDRK